MLPPMPWRVGPQPSQRPWRREVVERVAHLADVDDVEREVVEVAVALVDQRHHVVVAVDVEPDAAVAEVVGDGHAQLARVEVGLLGDRAR